MAKGRPVTTYTFDNDDGIYIFNGANMKRLKSESRTKSEKHFVERIAEKTGYSESAVKAWLRGEYGPTDTKAIEVLADFFKCDKCIFLKKIDERKKEMRTISDSERTAAREIYGEMLEMMYLLDWEEPNPTEDAEKIQRIRTAVTGRFKSVEEAYEHYMLAIRKTRLDLPGKVRLALTQLVDDCFGDFEQTYDFLAAYDPDGVGTSMYFNSPAYGEYLEKHGQRDTFEMRYEYEYLFKTEVAHRLDEIFEDYIRI